jgi:hypothetical protein
MAHRSNNVKQARRLRKHFRRQLPAYIDLVQWLQDHRHAQTAGQAKRLMLDGKVRVAANAVGRKSDPRARAVGFKGLYLSTDGWVLDPYLPAQFRNEIHVSSA